MLNVARPDFPSDNACDMPRPMGPWSLKSARWGVNDPTHPLTQLPLDEAAKPRRENALELRGTLLIPHPIAPLEREAGIGCADAALLGSLEDAKAHGQLKRRKKDQSLPTN